MGGGQPVMGAQRVKDREEYAIRIEQTDPMGGRRTGRQRGHDAFDQTQEDDEPQHGDGQRLERFLAPIGHEQSPAAGRQRRRDADHQRPNHLVGPRAPQQRDKKQHGDRDDDQRHHHQQAGEQFAEDELVIAEVGHQEQDQRLPVLLLGHATRRKQEREEQNERELYDAEDLKDEAAEPGHIAKAADLLPAEHRLHGGVHQHKQGGHVARADKKMLELTRRS